MNVRDRRVKKSPWPTFNVLEDHKASHIHIQSREIRKRKKKRKNATAIYSNISAVIQSLFQFYWEKQFLVFFSILICLFLSLHASDLWCGTWDILTIERKEIKGKQWDKKMNYSLGVLSVLLTIFFGKNVNRSTEFIVWIVFYFKIFLF